MSLSKLNIPKTITVGFQKRTDTYTNKLAYVIYTDQKGKLRKETSWQSWRDKSIDSEKYDNVPTSGFVLNKKVGDYKSDWNHRSAAVRIYDPRGFEFEISVENLLFILQECSSIKGKGLEGDFVYSWDGPELVLLPVSSQEYKESSDFTSLQTKKVTKADIKEGRIYVNKNDEKVLYLGRFDWTVSDHSTVYGKDHYDRRDYSNYTNIYKIKTTKKHVFRYIDKKGYSDYNYWLQDGFTGLATMESSDVSSLFADFYDELKSKCKHIGKDFEIKKMLKKVKNVKDSYYYSLYFRKDDKNYSIEKRHNYNYVAENTNQYDYYIKEYVKDSEYSINEGDLICTVINKRNSNNSNSSDRGKIITIEEIEKLIEEKIIFKNKNNNCTLQEI